jgi:2-polyprenyl-6-methoxyphenol hydroxylase-like FAD-dependent oxidoreductase
VESNITWIFKMSTDTFHQEHFLAGKKIIVAGAGIAGVSFTIALRKLWPTISDPGSSLDPVSITIYERDAQDVIMEREGSSLSIRGDTYSGGMQALRKLGLLEPMLRASLTGVKGDKGGFAIWDKDWKELIRMEARNPDPSLPAASMRIMRRELRRILLEAVPASDIIHWATFCTGAVQLSNGRVQVQLSNGKTDECDILVAADGASSKIRAFLRPDDKLLFAGAVCISGVARFPDGIPKPVDRDWGPVVGASGTGLFVSPMDKDRALWSLSYLVPTPREKLQQPIAQAQADELLQETLDRGKQFAQPFKTLVQATDISTLSIYNAKDKNPFPHVDKNQKFGHVIFIGDSNHAMSPFAGNGANMALMDGWELAEQLCKSRSLMAALMAYDASSMPRSKSAIQMSRRTISMAHAQGWRLAVNLTFFKLMKLVFFRAYLKQD